MKINAEGISSGLGSEEAASIAPPVSIIGMFDAFYRDNTGVPLSSDRRQPEEIAGIDFKYRPNKFRTSPSRFPNGNPHVIPVSGLEQQRLGETYRDMMQFIKMVRSGFIDLLPEDRDKNAPLSSGEMKILLDAFVFLPHYLVNKTQGKNFDEDTLPPFTLVLTNSAAGTEGALGAWFDIYQDDDPNFLQKTPQVDEMIRLSEYSGAMAPIGNKTVCAASPAQQRHFIAAIIDGPDDKSVSDQELEILDPSEIAQFINFGIAMNQGNAMLGQLRRLDSYLSESARGVRDVATFMPDRKSEAEERVASIVRQFDIEAQSYLPSLNKIEVRVNLLLGRSMHGAGVITTETLFESHNFRIKEFSRQETPND